MSDRRPLPNDAARALVDKWLDDSGISGDYYQTCAQAEEELLIERIADLVRAERAHGR